MHKKRLYIFGVFVLLAGGVFYYSYREQQKTLAIDSFEECAAAQNIVLETYPGQCRTKDGRSFTQDIGNELEMREEIMVSFPRPTQLIASPLKIKGQARGSWFFEASAPVKLLNSGNKVIATGHIQAQGEWMTEDFVPFTGELTFTAPQSTKGTLLLEKDNPSGLKENAAHLRIPIKFD